MKKKCEDCNAECCKYIVLDIDPPEALGDFENIRWYASHKNVEVFVDFEGIWNVRFITKCDHLDDSNRCNIYNKRPAICREFSPKTCSKNDENEDLIVFKNLEDVDEYIKNVFKKGKHLVK
jgi:uncharacterized protein